MEESGYGDVGLLNSQNEPISPLEQKQGPAARKLTKFQAKGKKNFSSKKKRQSPSDHLEIVAQVSQKIWANEEINDEVNAITSQRKKSPINADIRPSRFDMLKKGNRKNFIHYREF